MYCSQCALHFSGLSSEGRCPYCGDPGEDTGGDARPSTSPAGRGGAEAVVLRDVPAVPPDSSFDPDRTRTESAPSDPWAPGVVIAGKYEIVSRLGSGGFGTVYKVRHTFRKKYYALKLPHQEFTRDGTFRARFEREIEAMERFVHSDAVMIRDSGVTTDGWPYYTMDFIEGESLRAVMHREGRIAFGRACTLVAPILRVLDVAHAHRIIHRDIKPDNVLLTTVGGRERVKVLDFGIAKLLDLVGESASITHGERIGTPKYMSPEQVAGRDLDARSDLFSLGIVFYEMLTGNHPFAAGRDPVRVTAAILEAEPPLVREVVPEIPRPLCEFVSSLLEKRRRRRPANAQAALRVLEGIEGASRTEPTGAFTVASEVRRAAAKTLVVRQETSAGERRCFVFFDERVLFGRSDASDSGRATHSQILLRCLPCRSPSSDPENWHKNLTISQSVGRIYPEGDALVIEPSPNAKYGICIGDMRSTSAVRIGADRFHLSIGDRVLELDGYRVARTATTSEWNLTAAEAGRPEGLSLPAFSGYSNPSAQIDSACLRRANNWPLHEYHFVYRLLRIGSSANAELRLYGAGISSFHAAIVSEVGEAFLTRLDGVVRVDGLIDEAGEELPPRELAPCELLPLTPGLRLLIGDTAVWMDEATSEDFKSQ